MRSLLLIALFIAISGCASIQNSSVIELPSIKPDIQKTADCMSNLCMTLIVANVGQGSGAVVELPNNEKMLIDAGYSANPTKGSPIENLKWAANKIGVTTKAPFDYVVLSHPDKDHVNLIDTLYKDGFISLSSTKAIHLGRLPAEYATDMKAKVFFDAIYNIYPKSAEQCNQNKKLNVAITVLCYKSDGVVPTELYQKNWPHSEDEQWSTYMISVNAGGSASNKVNANSLVVGFYLAGRVIGILPGDATEVTTNAILAANPANQPMISNVALYSIAHHGADTHGSNNLDWLNAMKANVYVASNARYGKWRHPSNTITRNIMDTPTLRKEVFNSPGHQLFQAYTDKTGKSAFCYCKDFSKSIFSTFSNGWFKIVADSDGAIEAQFESTEFLPPQYAVCDIIMCQ